MFANTIFIGALIVSNFKIERERVKLEKTLWQLNTKIEQLKKRQEQIRQVLSKIQDGTYLEELARERGFVKDGEEKIVIKRIESEKETSQPSIWFQIFRFFTK